MSTWIWLLLIIIPMLFLFIYWIIFYLIFKNENNNSLMNKGICTFRLDLYNRKIKIFPYFYKIDSSKIINIFPFLKKNNKWIRFTTLIKTLNMEEEDFKKFIELIDDLEKNPSYNFFNMNSLVSNKKKEYSFFLEFYPKFIESDFLFSIKFKPIIQKNKLEYNRIKYISLEEMIQNKNKYIGFLSFGIKSPDAIKKIEKIFMLTISNEFYLKKEEEIISLVFFNKNRKKIEKIIDKTKKNLIKIIKDLKFNFIYNGTSKTIFNKISTKKKYLDTIKSIRYLIIISNTKKMNFPSQSKISMSHFREYNNNFNLFKEDIASKNIKTKLLDVKHYTKKNKIISYGFPEFNSKINKKMLNQFLKNWNYRNKLINAHVSLLDEKQLDESIILDINSNWFLENYYKLKNNKIIYILNTNDFKDLRILKKIISQMQMKNFKFAIKISNFEPQIGIFIKTIKLEYLIISSSIWKTFQQNQENIFLSTIKHVIKNKDIKKIFENPPKNINSKRAKQIGLEFAYYFN